MKYCCQLLLILSLIFLACATETKKHSHKLVKRQFPSRSSGRAFPLSRSRQYPPPEELDEEEEEEDLRSFPIRSRPPQSASEEEDYSEDYSDSEQATTTTPAPKRPTARTFVFNNRFAGRPRFGQTPKTSAPRQTTSTTTTTTTARPRFRATPAQSQRLDVVANILNKPSPSRPTPRTEGTSSRRPVAGRARPRGRFRTRTSSTTTTTTTSTTTTTTEAPPEEYYYYYEDEEDITTKPPTTTTTTTKRPSLPRRPSSGRRTSRPTVLKFDPESQFAPPPEEPLPVEDVPKTTKKFTTSTTTTPPPGGIPAHLRSKYRPRADGRFIDFLRDPNRPRELKGFDLTDYPFYINVPDDITFDCEDKKDGYYASVPHKCQLFHYCFAGARYDFLCANYTLYDQTTFTCRFANNVDCPSSEKYYNRNDDLWKETTTTEAPTQPPKRRKITPKDDEEDYDEYYDDYYEEEERPRRRRPPKRRRNRRKNRRKPTETPEE